MEDIIIIDNDDQDVILIDDSKKENDIIILENQAAYAIDYEKAINKPKINEKELIGNLTSEDLRLQDEMHELTNLEIEKIWKG